MEPECEAIDAPIFFFESEQTNGFLSPEFLSSFEHRNIQYNCNEQFFQAAKAMWFEDVGERYRSIMRATDPQEQKALGKHIEGNDFFYPWFWAALLAYQVVLSATRLKFTLSEHAPMLAQKLMATGHRELVMADPNDALLGIGMDQVLATAHVGPWSGENLLGKALMAVRMKLRVELSLHEGKKVFSMARFRVLVPMTEASEVETVEEAE